MLRLLAVFLIALALSAQIFSGPGLTGNGTSGSPVAIDPASGVARLSVAGTLTFPSIAQSVCNEQSLTLTGASVGDETVVAPPPNIDQGFLWSGYISSANTATVRLCKITSGTVTPVALSWRLSVVRSF